MFVFCWEESCSTLSRPICCSSNAGEFLDCVGLLFTDIMVIADELVYLAVTFFFGTIIACNPWIHVSFWSHEDHRFFPD